MQTGGRASGRECGRSWRTVVSGGTEVPAMSGPRQCEVRSEESPSERAGSAAQEVKRTVGVLCSVSVSRLLGEAGRLQGWGTLAQGARGARGWRVGMFW